MKDEKCEGTIIEQAEIERWMNNDISILNNCINILNSDISFVYRDVFTEIKGEKLSKIKEDYIRLKELKKINK